MSWAGIGVIGGLSMAGAGLGLSASSASSQAKAMKRLANTPKLDLSGIQRQAFGDMSSDLGTATGISKRMATSNQDVMNQLLEQSLPGFTAQRNQALGTAGSYLKGEIPSDVSAQVQRSAAARALGGGYGGAGMHGALTARDLGRTSMDIQGQGLQWLNALRGMSPMAQSPNLMDFFMTPGQRVQAEISQRGQNMGVGSQAAQMPGAMGVLGPQFQQMGALSAGMGAGQAMNQSGSAGGWSTSGGNWAARGGSIGPNSSRGAGSAWGKW